MEWLLAFIALLAMASTFGLGIAQLIYSNRRADKVDARDKQVREDERERARDDARSTLVSRRRDRHVAAVEHYVAVCTIRFSRLRINAGVALAQRRVSDDLHAESEQLATAESDAFVAASALGLKELGTHIADMWTCQLELTRLLNDTPDPVAGDVLVPFIRRLTNSKARIQEGLATIELEAN